MKISQQVCCQRRSAMRAGAGYVTVGAPASLEATFSVRLLEAMMFFKLTEGIIVTLDQKDRFERDGHLIKLIPAHEYVEGV
jgi:hypothetical protein